MSEDKRNYIRNPFVRDISLPFASEREYDAAVACISQRMKEIGAKPVFFSGTLPDGSVRKEYVLDGSVQVLANCYSCERIDLSVKSKMDKEIAEKVFIMLVDYLAPKDCDTGSD